ncbi:hypothetical protein FACS1894190_14100 [Spirochaetia bacterium]|nr:hypothetical protein FACS1894190_14070 [Spirochaetia bacterium]GHU43520.1 hypothetical protein FACS1894190_14100 [Spirochaetia bacterium]
MESTQKWVKNLFPFSRTVKDFFRLFVSTSVLNKRRIALLKERSADHLSRRTQLRFDIHVSEHCNLNCKGCLHFSTLAEKKFYDIAIFERDCQRISELTNGVLCDLNLLGGEPLLNPNLCDFFPIAKKYFPKTQVVVVTNGILLTKQPDLFWEKCKQYNIEIALSVYPVKIDFLAIKNICNENQIKLSLRGHAIGKKNWNKQPLDLKGEQEIEKTYQICELANGCIQLVNGKLYQCEISAYIKDFNKFFNQNLEIKEKDYIDIYKVTSLDEILDFLCKPIPFCRYCKTNKVEITDWARTKREINEWA